MPMTLTDLIFANPGKTDAEIVTAYNAQPPVPKPSGPATYVTYLSIGEDVARFGAGAMNFAGDIRTGLDAWIAGPDLSTIDPRLPNTGVLRTLADRLAGGKGVDLSSPTAPAIVDLFASGVPDLHPPIITAEQAAALLSIGYDSVTPATAEDVAAERARIARETLAARWTDVYNAIAAKIGSGELADFAAVQAAVAGVS